MRATALPTKSKYEATTKHVEWNLGQYSLQISKIIGRFRIGCGSMFGQSGVQYFDGDLGGPGRVLEWCSGRFQGRMFSKSSQRLIIDAFWWEGLGSTWEGFGLHSERVRNNFCSLRRHRYRLKIELNKWEEPATAEELPGEIAENRETNWEWRGIANQG